MSQLGHHQAIGKPIGVVQDDARPVLETERLVLRMPEPDDYDVARQFYCSERSQYAGGGADKSETHGFVVMAAMIGHWALRSFGTFTVIEKATGATVGGVGPHFPAGWPERELGWCIWDQRFEGKGYAYEAVLATREYVFGDLGWDTAVSYIDVRNTRSVQFAERLGCYLDDEAASPNKDPRPLVYRHPHPGKDTA